MADVNYDGVFNQKDVEIFAKSFNGELEYSNLQKQLMDLNENGSYDEEDVRKMLEMLYQAVFVESDGFVQDIKKEDFDTVLAEFGYIHRGDLNGDHIVNGRDLYLLQKAIRGNWDGSQPRTREYGDINGDGYVNEEDSLELGSKIGFIDLNRDGIYDIEDIKGLYDYICGLDMGDWQKEHSDLNVDGRIDIEDMNIMLYGYYANMNTNPNLTKEQFYGTVLSPWYLEVGDFNSDRIYDDYDMKVLKDTYNGEIVSFINLVLGDINKDLHLDEKDLEIYEEKYMSDIPFTYTVDTTNQTMKITGVNDTQIRFADIAASYCINTETYTVIEIDKETFRQCTNLDAIYIPETVTTIEADTRKEALLYNISRSNCIRIYCEASEEPEGYGSFWSTGSDGVIYNYRMKNVEDYFYYEADTDNKTLTLTGVKNQWYQDYGKELNIDDRYLLNGEIYQVTEIADYAFAYEDEIEVVDLPSTLLKIGNCAFEDIEYLESIDLMSCWRLKEIGSNAFANVKRIGDVFIRASVEIMHADTLEESLFWNCNVEKLYILVEASGPKEGWGLYWNYIDEDTVADTTYLIN